MDEGTMEKFAKELAIISRVRHRNVVRFIGAVTEQPNLCVITELMARGSMHDLLHKVGLRPDPDWLLRIASDVAHGCRYLHECKPPIIHRDLKSQNILVDEKWTSKIADFGLSRFFQVDLNTMTGQIGTPGWTAPEVFKSSNYDHKVDVYSYAILLGECASGEKPFAGMDAMQIAFATVYRNKRPDLPPSCPPAIAKLARTCWDSDPAKRPSFPAIISSLRKMRRERLVRAAEVGSGRSSANHIERSHSAARAVASAERSRRGVGEAKEAPRPSRLRESGAIARPSSSMPVAAASSAAQAASREQRAEQPRAGVGEPQQPADARRAVSEARQRHIAPGSAKTRAQASSPTPHAVSRAKSSIGEHKRTPSVSAATSSAHASPALGGNRVGAEAGTPSRSRSTTPSNVIRPLVLPPPSLQ
mmetsp:Transcript_25400/g.58784  ORF Transcript_25400/g.58784 Transcript_25400/m.58784 type:complete len:418 (-) Transcript_25400:52-1305(-)